MIIIFDKDMQRLNNIAAEVMRILPPTARLESTGKSGYALIMNDIADCRDSRIEWHGSFVCAYEGGIFPPAGDNIHSSYINNGEEFVLNLNGIFNLFLWDDQQKVAIITNDKLGLDPFYYARSINGTMIFASQLATFLKVVDFKREVDKIALLQYASTNYILEGRTWLKDVYRLPPATMLKYDGSTLNKTSYWSLYDAMQSPVLKDSDFYEQYINAFQETLTDWTLDNKKVGLLLSGGYDSRSILAGLAKLGIKGNAYTWDNPRVKETLSARMLADKVGFTHRFIPYDIPCGITDETIREVSGHTDFQFPLFHIGRYNAVKNIGDEVDILFSGQGETIRVAAVPNDYINSFVHTMIVTGKPETGHADHFFRCDAGAHDYVEAFNGILRDRSEYSYINIMTKFLFTEAYRNDYGILRYGESRQILTLMPFLKSRIAELLLRSNFSISRMKSWRNDIFTTFRSRRIYYELIRRMSPGLLSINLDRGYPPAWDRDARGFLMTGMWGIRSRLSLNRSGEMHCSSPWAKFVQAVLCEPRTLRRDYYRRQDLEVSLRKNMMCSPEECYELEKVARFELWYRHFIENDKL